MAAPPEPPTPNESSPVESPVSRRGFLKLASGGLALGAGMVGLSQAAAQHDHYGGGASGPMAEHGAQEAPPPTAGHDHAAHAGIHAMGTVGTVNTDYPEVYLRTFNTGQPVPADVVAKAQQEGWPAPQSFFEIHAIDREVEIAPGVMFPAWTYALRRDGERELPLVGDIPGPTMRCREGEEVVVKFVNQASHPHTIHFHGVHEARFDGGFPDQFVYPGQEFWYRFRAEPYGLHLYHCHVTPLKRHLHKGMYGTFIIDPDPRKGTRTPAGLDPEGRPQEYVMMMNAFDTNFDGENEFYAVNSVPFYYSGNRSIRVRRNTLIRCYVVNITEFDPINSFHLHANFFYTIRTGTRILTWGDEAAMEQAKDRFEFTDLVMMCQAERAILEFKLPYEGTYMFHAHQSEFVELGWMAHFEVVA